MWYRCWYKHVFIMHTTKGFTQEKTPDRTMQNVETYLQHCPMTVYNIHLLAIISVSVFFDVFSQQGDRFPPPPPPQIKKKIKKKIFFKIGKEIFVFVCFFKIVTSKKRENNNRCSDWTPGAFSEYSGLFPHLLFSRTWKDLNPVITEHISAQ